MKKIKHIIMDRFKYLNIDKIVMYKNPNECNRLELERINPNHVAFVYGKRKRKLNKGNNLIRIAKIYFHSLPLIVGLSVMAWIDFIFDYSYRLLLQTGFYGLITTLLTMLLYLLFLKEVQNKNANIRNNNTDRICNTNSLFN